MFKKAKEWIRNGLSIGRFKSVMEEKRLSADLEQQEFIRGKRNLNHLPDSWNTQWIKRPKKSWKEKSKNKHQYDQVYHTLSEKVRGINFELRDKFEENEFLFLLKTKFKNDWYYFYYAQDKNGKIDLKDLYSISFENSWYEVSERLIKADKLEAIYYTHTWDFDNFGIIERRTKNFILAVRLKNN
jgi:hypothetical protein